MNSIMDYSLFIFIIINVLVIANFDKIKFFRYILDKPDRKKKLHQKQMPLAGGIILITNILVYFIIIKVNGNIFQQKYFLMICLIYMFLFLLLLLFFVLACLMISTIYHLTINFYFYL